jgi:multidrug transporter EmrE-like cation transporter
MGVVFSLLAAVTLNTGNLVQKHAMAGLPEGTGSRTSHLLRALVGSRRWLFGLFLCLVGLLFQVFAFALAPIPVVQSIFNAGIVFLIVASRIKLGERLVQIEWIGLAVVVVSLTLITASLGQSEGSVGLTNSWARVLGAGGVTLVVVAGIFLLLRAKRGPVGFLFGAASGLLYGAAALGTKGASTLLVRHGVWNSIPQIVTSIYPYVFLVFSVLGMLIYQTGIQRSRISVVGTMSDVICSTYLVAVGMVVFGESLPHNPVTVTLRIGGFIGVLLGTVLVASGGREGSDMPPIESDIGLGPVLLAEVDSLSGHVPDSSSGQ